jgi:hypothetical protein
MSCAKTNKPTKYWLNKKREFTDEHIAKLAISNQKKAGKNHWNWRGGTTTENEKIRRSRSYIKWRTKVFERDGFTCQKCRKKSKAGERLEIHAHHIKSFAKNKTLRFAVSNGVTLCRACHMLTDSWGVKIKS